MSQTATPQRLDRLSAVSILDQLRITKHRLRFLGTNLRATRIRGWAKEMVVSIIMVVVEKQNNNSTVFPVRRVEEPVHCFYRITCLV